MNIQQFDYAPMDLSRAFIICLQVLWEEQQSERGAKFEKTQAQHTKSHTGDDSIP